MSDETRTVRVERRSYSRSPWRLIDSQTGCEVVVDSQPFDHPDLGPMTTGVPGYATKAEAVEALGRLAALAQPITRDSSVIEAMLEVVKSADNLPECEDGYGGGPCFMCPIEETAAAVSRFREVAGERPTEVRNLGSTGE